MDVHRFITMPLECSTWKLVSWRSGVYLVFGDKLNALRMYAYTSKLMTEEVRFQNSDLVKTIEHLIVHVPNVLVYRTEHKPT